MNLKSEIGIEINFSLDFTYRVFVPCSGYQINRTLKDVDRFRTHSDENINNNRIYINLPRIYIFLIINWNIIKKLEIYDKVLKIKPLLEKSIPIMNCCFI